MLRKCTTRKFAGRGRKVVFEERKGGELRRKRKAVSFV